MHMMRKYNAQPQGSATFLDFCSTRKYTKYSLNVTFGWECNDIPSSMYLLLRVRCLYSGRILNRFSKDVGCMDELLPRAMLECIQVFLVMVGVLVMVAIVNHWMIIPMVIIAIVFYVVRLYYLNTAQDVKRLEGIGNYTCNLDK